MSSKRPASGLWTLLAFVLLSFSILAAPFAKLFTFTQPDGTRIELSGKGDEFYAVFETVNGYTAIYDPAVRAHCYAKLTDDKSDLVSSGVQVHQAQGQDLGLVQHLRAPRATVQKKAAARHKIWDDATQVSQRWQDLKASAHAAEAATASGIQNSPPANPTIGNYVGLTLLIDFSDQVGTITPTNVWDFCNGTNFTMYGNRSSVKKYYQDVSNNRLTYSNMVTLYVRAPQPKTYYDDGTKDAGTQARLLLGDVITAMQALPNFNTDFVPLFASLSTNSSGNVRAFNVFYAGSVSSGWSLGLWPHSWSLAAPVALYAGGPKVYNYEITDMGSSLAIGTFCHENGHMLCGFPDIYDYDGSSVGGAGMFCLMNNGNWGNGGLDPVQVCAYLKTAAGWANISNINNTSMLTGVLTSAMGTNFNFFYRYQKPGVATEYFLLENRQKAVHDSYIPANGGIAIWHIDELGDKNNESLTPNTSHLNYEVTLVQADNLWDFENNVNSGETEDLYFLGNTASGYANQFSDSTAPNAHWWDGTNSNLLLRNFSLSGTTMTFGIGADPTPPIITVQPQSLAVIVGQSATFNVVATGALPMYYQWYFNGAPITNSNNSTYTIASAQVTNSGTYYVVITNALGKATSSNALLTVFSLAIAVDATNLVWTTGGDAYWFPETSTTFDGVNADQSGKIGDGQQSWIETTVVGPATLSFYCKVSSELGFDKLQFYTNGAPYPNNGAPPYPQFEISGEIDWHQRTFALAPGTNVLRWRYIKDGSGASGTDAAWLDQVQVAVPTPPQITSVLTNQSVIIGSNATFSVTATGTAPLLYQWYYNGAPIGYSNGLSIANTFGAAFGGVAALGIANAQPADAKNYYVVVTNLYGSATSSIATLTVIPLLPLAVAVNNPGLAVATGGDAPWLGLPTITHDGVAAAQSGFIGDAMQSWMEITVVGPSHIGFWWKVSSETNTDYLEFTLNGVRTNLISGEVDWTRVGYDVPAGTNVVRWNYVKNGSVSAGQDAGWVDQILIGRPPVVVQNPPSRLTVPLHGGTNLSVTVSGDLPMQYQWYLDATALAHATNTQLSLAQVQYVQSGPYSLVISNTYGVVTSTPARLLILPPGQIHTNTASVAGTITIPSAGPASVYPFTNLIAGVTGSVQQVTLTVSNLTHPYPADLQMLLVSPTGQAVLFLAGGSNGAPVAGATLTFDDTAATGVPAQSAITSGVYRPTVIGLVPALPAPAPTNGYATNLAAFTGSDPNGVWSLFINAGSTNGAAAGSVAGWSLNFVTQPAVIPPAIFPPAITSGQILFSLRPEVGKTVYIEYKDNLQQTLWQALTNFPGDGNLHTISNLTSGASGRFYRMYLQ